MAQSKSTWHFDILKSTDVNQKGEQLSQNHPVYLFDQMKRTEATPDDAQKVYDSW